MPPVFVHDSPSEKYFILVGIDEAITSVHLWWQLGAITEGFCGCVINLCAMVGIAD